MKVITATEQLTKSRDLYLRDYRMHTIAQSAVASAMEHHRTEMQYGEITMRQVHEVALNAVIQALAMTYENDAEIKRLRQERDHYEKTALRQLELTPITTVFGGHPGGGKTDKLR